MEEEVTQVVSDTNINDEWRARGKLRIKRMRYEKRRLDSFEPCWLDRHQLDVIASQRLSRNGFYRTVSGGTVCFSCGLWKHADFWQNGYNPVTVHRKDSPNCKFVNGLSKNVPIEPKKQCSIRINTLNTGLSVEERFPNSKSKKSLGIEDIRQSNSQTTTEAQQTKKGKVTENEKSVRPRKPTSPCKTVKIRNFLQMKRTLTAGRTKASDARRTEPRNSSKNDPNYFTLDSKGPDTVQTPVSAGGSSSIRTDSSISSFVLPQHFFSSDTGGSCRSHNLDFERAKEPITDNCVNVARSSFNDTTNIPPGDFASTLNVGNTIEKSVSHEERVTYEHVTPAEDGNSEYFSGSTSGPTEYVSLQCRILVRKNSLNFLHR